MGWGWGWGAEMEGKGQRMEGGKGKERKTEMGKESLAQGEKPSHVVRRHEGVGERCLRGGIRRLNSEPPDGERHEQ